MGPLISIDRPSWSSGRTSAQRSGGRGFKARPGQTEDFEIGTLVATSLDASIMRLVPGQVGTLSVYCDWVGGTNIATLVHSCVAAL